MLGNSVPFFSESLWCALIHRNVERKRQSGSTRLDDILLCAFNGKQRENRKRKHTFPVGLVCDVHKSVCDALTGRNVTSAAGSRMKDRPQPTLTHTSQPEKDAAKGQ